MKTPISYHTKSRANRKLYKSRGNMYGFSRLLPLIFVMVIIYILHYHTSFSKLGLSHESYSMNSFSTDRLEDQNIHFTHVFSSYKGSREEQRKEYEIVMRSWEEAIKVAELHGIRVETIDALLTDDKDSIPGFTSKTIYLKRKVKTLGKIYVPTVGEIFKVGVEHGSGEWLVYTNSDIGFVPDFYIKLWNFLNTGGFEILHHSDKSCC